MLNGPLAKSAGGLELCKPKDGKRPNLFTDKADPDCVAMLRAIEQGSVMLYAKPRMDMPGGKAIAYPTNFVGPFNSFGGP